MITVKYTGEYPNACRGALYIYRDGELIKEYEKYTFCSTGECYFINDYEDSVIESGELEFCDEDEFVEFVKWASSQPDTKQILEAVKDCMESANVCCGGCL